MTAESNFNKNLVNSVGIKAAKAKLEKKFYIISLENILVHICSHCCKCWTARTWPYEPCHFKLLLWVFVEVDLDFADPFEFKVDWATHCETYHFPHFTCLQVSVVHLEVNLTVGTKFISDEEFFMGSKFKIVKLDLLSWVSKSSDVSPLLMILITAKCMMWCWKQLREV
jgi:hypothetical protein